MATTYLKDLQKQKDSYGCSRATNYYIYIYTTSASFTLYIFIYLHLYFVLVDPSLRGNQIVRVKEHSKNKAPTIEL